MTSYVSPYSGQTINPSQVGYESLTISTDTLLQWPINGNTTNVVANIIDVTATVGSLRVFLAPATEVSTGQTVLFRNLGANSFTVVDNSGNTIVSISSGIAQYIYLTDNTTINGVWESVTLGAGTSAANAASLAGYGLQAVSTKLNTVNPVSSIFSSYNIPISAQSGVYVWGGGAGTLTLPVASQVPNGWYVVIINNGTGTLNVTPQNPDTINGQTNAQQNPGESFVVVSNNSTYVTYGYGQSQLFAFTELSLNVTGGTVTLSDVQASSVIQQYYGNLVSNCTVVFPQIVQFYAVSNNTTGAFSLTFTTGVIGGTTVVLPQGQTLILICDGKNVYNANSATISYIPSLTLGDGSAANPSLHFFSDNFTGLYLAGVGLLGFSVSGSNVGTFTATGFKIPVGIPGGSF